MKISAIFSLFTFTMCGLLAGCGSAQTQEEPPPTAEVGENTAIKYAQWTDGQLELKRAQLRHELDRPYVDAGPPALLLIAQSGRDDQQHEVEQIEAELLRRDPSGGLLEKSNRLLSDGSQAQQ